MVWSQNHNFYSAGLDLYYCSFHVLLILAGQPLGQRGKLLCLNQPCTLTSLFLSLHTGAQRGQKLGFEEMHWTTLLVQSLLVHANVWTYAICFMDCTRLAHFKSTFDTTHTAHSGCASWSVSHFLELHDLFCIFSQLQSKRCFHISHFEALPTNFLFTSSFYLWYVINVIQSDFQYQSALFYHTCVYVCVALL